MRVPAAAVPRRPSATLKEENSILSVDKTLSGNCTWRIYVLADIPKLQNSYSRKMG